MAKIPILQEIGTSFMSLGDAICGDTKKARQRWVDYSEESLIGSFGVMSYHKIDGNDKKADQYAKGFLRTTGQVLCGGGLLENVPVFQEIATCGKSLGDAMVADTESARNRWGVYAENSTIGSSVYAVGEHINGNHEHAQKLWVNSGKSLGSGAMTLAAGAATVMSGGLAAPLGAAAAVGAGATAGLASSAACTGVEHLMNGGENISGGDYVGGALLGGVSGAMSGYGQSKAYKEVQTAKNDAANLKMNEKLMQDQELKESTSTIMTHDDARNEGASHGLNNKSRNDFFGRQKGKDGKFLKRGPGANEPGSTSYPNGCKNIEAIPGVDNCSNGKLQIKGGESKWPMNNCAEPHALENLKGNNPGAVPKANYTLGADRNGNITVKAPCKNCAAAGIEYGKVPFAKYDGQSVADATKAHIGKAAAHAKNLTRASVAVVALGQSKIARNEGNSKTKETAMEDSPKSEDENETTKSEDESDDFCP